MPRLDVTPELLHGALAGEPAQVRALVDALTPIVQARVARVLLRRASAGRGRDVRQELEDLAQEVFAALFAERGRLLRLWSPEGGLSPANFVGLLAEREAISILRSGRRSPWTEDPTLDTDLGELGGQTATAHAALESRDFLEALLDRLRAQLSPKGLQLFVWLLVEQRAVDEVMALSGLSADAVYAWKSRLGKQLRLLAAEISSTGSSDAFPALRIPSTSGSRGAA
jgi:DNA-directed RNA polymerase specialized sigma24 family protein